MKISRPDTAGWMPLPPPSCTSAQRSWLLRPGALTGGLRGLGIFDLRVLAEYAQAAAADEARAMRLRPRARVWVREVIMSIDGVDCVLARSLTPLPASKATWQGMRRLCTRPLADMLYHDRTVRRTAFECRRLAAGIPFFRAARGHIAGGRLEMPDNGTGPGYAWPAAHRAGRILARRSVFWRHGQPLLVAEAFLAAFWEKAQRSAH